MPVPLPISSLELVHFSVQSNHIHLIVEAQETRALSRGMQGLAEKRRNPTGRAHRATYGWVLFLDHALRRTGARRHTIQ